jgi:gliding motility-associated-like protein
VVFPALNAGETISINYRALGVREDKPVYQLVWTNESAVGCTSRSTVDVVFEPQPRLQVGVTQPLCANAGDIQLAAVTETTALAGSGTYFGSGVVGNGSRFDPEKAGIGDHRLKYAFAAANGCHDTAEFVQKVLPSPVVEAGPDKVLLPGGQVTLNGSSSLPAASVLWVPAAGLAQGNGFQPEATPIADQWYRLLVTAENGCKGEDSVFVKVLPALAIPNAFSPNGDGINDRWLIAGLDSYPECEVMIFDRYGQVVHRQAGYNKPWDGSKNGKPVSVGTYYYLIRPGSGAKPVQGSITLLR